MRERGLGARVDGKRARARERERGVRSAGPMPPHIKSFNLGSFSGSREIAVISRPIVRSLAAGSTAASASRRRRSRLVLPASPWPISTALSVTDAADAALSSA